MTTQPRMTVIPLTVAAANRVVARIHRHHNECPAGLVYFAIGAVNLDEDRLCGAAIVGRPANRHSDKEQTGEVLRVATDGTPNAPSVLYGACAQAARRMGFSRLITYTLDSEPGTSLRASGWTLEDTGLESNWVKYGDRLYNGKKRIVKPLAHYGETKQRWVVTLRPPLFPDIALAQPNTNDNGQIVLGLEVPA